jgi:plasmid stabilization system protein ParE
VRRNVRILPAAEADLDRLCDWLATRSPRAAVNAADAIIDAVYALAEFSERGRLTADPEFRELLVDFGRDGYVVRYRIRGAAVVVVRIFHGRERR